MISSREALDRLQEGNRRFVGDARNPDSGVGRERRDRLISGQQPFAIILGCSDSRVPPELVFDQGLGDLFVIRVAGNVVTPVCMDSVTFAAAHLGTPLIVVMGHSRCGAVQAAVENVREKRENQPTNLPSIINPIRPLVEESMAAEPQSDFDHLVRITVRANVRSAVDQIRAGSDTLERLVRDDGLLVVGAEYSIETGVVDFIYGLDGAA
jgi:carbonic anhydrase